VIGKCKLVKSIQITGKKFLLNVMMTSFGQLEKETNYRVSLTQHKRFFARSEGEAGV